MSIALHAGSLVVLAILTKPNAIRSVISHHTDHFKNHDPYPEEATLRKERVPLDQAILEGARKITNQSYLFNYDSSI